MFEKISIKEKNITIYFNDENSKNKKLPVVIFNSYNNNDGKTLWEECLKIKCPEFIFVVIEVTNWNDDMTPWPSDPVFKNASGYGGQGDAFIKYIEEEVLHRIEEEFQPEYYTITGYSLSGLFSIYTMFKSTKFSRFGSGSGSFWYNGFMDYTSKTAMACQPEKVYLSLGNKEKKTGNPTLKTIETETLNLKSYFEKLNIPVKFEFNIGNHFVDVDSRVANGIKWLLE